MISEITRSHPPIGGNQNMDPKNNRIGIFDKVQIRHNGEVGIVTRMADGLFDVSVELLDPSIEPLQDQYRKNRTAIRCGKIFRSLEEDDLRLLKRFIHVDR